MHQQPAERLCADFALTNVLVAIDTATQRRLGIVYMDDGNARKPDGALDQVESRGESSFAPDVITSGKKMRGIEARTDLQPLKGGHDLTKLFQAPAERVAHPRSVLD